MPKTGDEMDGQKLLKHLPEYGVLVCKTCQFAIQPSALSSHLLRHQIYRSERRQLLEQLKGLDLREPEHVTYPRADVLAIPELPVYRGWLCQTFGCGHACASEKRMAQHWSDQHGSREVDARPAWLQTFFRGNKIRYFEVSEPMNAPTPMTDSEDGHSDRLRRPSSMLPSSRELTPHTERSSSSLDYGRYPKPAYSTNLSPSQLNILNLELMHHWSTVTSLTVDRGTEPQNFWTKTITTQALSGNEFLMYGCLSAAAFHLAIQYRHIAKWQEYREIGLEYQGYSVTAFRKALATGSKSEANLAFNRLLGITRLSEHHLDPDSTDSALQAGLMCDVPCLAILECIMLIRMMTDMWCESNHELPDSSGMKLPHEVFMGLASLPGGHLVDYSMTPSPSLYPYIPRATFDQLRSIPARICSELYVTSEVDLVAIKHAYACVLTCFDRSYANNEIWSKWNAVEGWTKMVPDRYLALLESVNPVAVVILAMWALLVKRLEAYHWYMQGETRRLFKFTRESLREDLRHVVDEIASFTV